MKEIILTRNQIAYVDDEDYEKVNQYKWYASKVKSKTDLFYARRAFMVNGKQKIVRLHTYIMGEPEIGLEIDYIDGNRLNCTKNNLRYVTHHQNTMNKHRHKKCKSKYKGVYLKNDGKTIWSAIGINNKRIYLGTFKTQEDAAIAYNNAAIMFFGNNCNLNIIK